MVRLPACSVVDTAKVSNNTFGASFVLPLSDTATLNDPLSDDVEANDPTMAKVIVYISAGL
jgi:hypothetical protein